jgi:predicted nucleotidyltransferase
MLHMEQNISFEIVEKLNLRESHIREVARAVNVNHMTAKRAIDSLVKRNILDYKTLGKNKVFFLKESLESRNEVLQAEIYKNEKILQKNNLLRPIFEKLILNKKIKVAILFGSYAKGLSHEKSDIDIYIETESLALKKEVESINSKISVKIGKFDKNNILFKEIIKNHIIIKGFEEFYEKTKNQY